MLTPLQLSRVFLPLLLVAVVWGAKLSGAEPPVKYFGAAAREIRSSLQSGQGWCALAARANVRISADPNVAAVDCLKYRVVTAYQFGADSNQEDYILLTYGAETPWISAEFGTPKASGPALAAAKAANDAVGLIDVLLGQLEPALNAEESAELRAAGQLIVGLLRSQRAALVDLIQKDIQAVGTMQ